MVGFSPLIGILRFLDESSLLVYFCVGGIHHTEFFLLPEISEDVCEDYVQKVCHSHKQDKHNLEIDVCSFGVRVNQNHLPPCLMD